MGEMAGYGMNPDPLNGAGRNIENLEPDARSASNGFLSAVLEAGSAAHHTGLAGALTEFHGRWSVPANRLAHNVQAAGSGVRAAAVYGDGGDQDGQADLTVAQNAATGQLSGLSRPINM